jgi:ABC-type branched-subunit amino acid transport system ATPase component
MVEVRDLVAGYGGAPVVHGVSFTLQRGEVLCLLGVNGAGKSTIAKTLCGLISATSGSVVVDGTDVSHAPAYRRLVHGLSLVPESRNLFTQLSARDNLILGAYTRKKAERAAALDGVLQLFPPLADLLERRAGDLSGGQQQMLAIARALMSAPLYVVFDEPSLGLAPIMVETILAKARALADQGVGVLLIEQNIDKALRAGDRAVVLENGRIALEGSAKAVRNDPRVVHSYLGAVA